MKAVVPYFTLNNGVRMPGVGAGCWLGVDGDRGVTKEMCLNALKCGYRHLDTAPGYGNEELVGDAIRESGLPRNELFVTTKLDTSMTSEDLSNDRWRASTAILAETEPWMPGRILTFDEHPNFVDAWKELEAVLQTGKVRAVGVSNFSIQNLEILLANTSVMPAVNQVEAHLCHPQDPLKQYCDERNILLSAYSPLGQGNPLYFTDAAVVQVAERHSATPAQVGLSWLVRRGIVPIVKSAKVERMKTNLELIDLAPEEMRALDSVHRKPGMHRSLVDYPHTPDGKVVGWTYAQLGWAMDVGGFVKIEESSSTDM
ncbi:hypothetical protein PHLGIDRAFT_119988 [Phlebiopsis gigantea 11061_1 CR5-6]|uniref:NADP-dependent oxidoreductase domain-containing protein n=1 Tax=Phlebiopsis gigantea (strain 11061_1 CR5-6) TaxID=745531 RepID=A0A0C3PHB9_PHLG1|nr:hypothetical protein PHLGIDRAFT_119988 [Phlebiopsis gigantea 11061_1 CR5-6]